MEITDILQNPQGFCNVTLAPTDDTVNQNNESILMGLVRDSYEVIRKDKSEHLDISHKRDQIKSKTCPLCRESFIFVKRTECHKSITHEQDDNTSNQKMCEFAELIS